MGLTVFAVTVLVSIGVGVLVMYGGGLLLHRSRTPGTDLTGHAPVSQSLAWPARSSDGAGVEVLVSAPSNSRWSHSAQLATSDSFEVQLRYENYSAEAIANVTLQAWLPQGLELVDAPATVSNSMHPQGQSLDGEAILGPGIGIGPAAAGSVATLTFRVLISGRLVRPTAGVAMFAIGARVVNPFISNWSTAAVVVVSKS